MDQTKQPFSFDKLDFSNVQATNYINVVVDGFWSTPVSIYIQRQSYYTNDELTWLFDVQHSSCGYEGVNDLQATLNFAMAIIAAVEYCKELQKDIPALEQAYQATHAAMIAKVGEERKAREAVLAADPEVGLTDAKMLIKLMKFSFESGKSPVVTTTQRASESVVTITPEWVKGEMRFLVNGKYHRTDRDVVEYLSQLSAKNARYCNDVEDSE